MTKILVVLLVVLCVAFSMTAIQFAATTNNWKSLAEGYRTEAQLADAKQRSDAAAHAAEVASLRDSIQTLRDRVAELERLHADAVKEAARAHGENAQLLADNRRADALVQRLTNELGIAQAARAEVENQRKDFESRNIDLERRNVDLNERVNELTTQVTVLVQQQRQQAQQIHVLREENKALADNAGIPYVGSPATPPTLPGSNVNPLSTVDVLRISGHVVAVDGDYVTISVGSADRVQKGATFVVYRADQYVGDIEINDVEPNLSAGRLVRARPGLSPATGDQVQDEYHFATPTAQAP